MLPRSLFAYFVSFSLLLQALIPFAANYEAQPQAKFSALFGDKILICTGEGFRWIETKELAEGKAHHPAPSHYKCPLCYVAAHGMSLAPQAVVLVPDTLAPQASILAYEGFFAGGKRLWSPLLTRAPPVAV